MYFGLTNSSATFQTSMNMIFADLIASNKVAVYMHDILIYSSDTKTHWQTIHKVLKRLEEYNLFLKPEKYEFDCDHIEYLRLVISQESIEMDQVKVKAIVDWHTPNITSSCLAWCVLWAI